MAMGLAGGSVGKESVCNVGDLGSIPGLGRSPEEGNSNPLQYFCLENPWTEEPGGLQSMGSQRVGYNLATKTHIYVNATFSICPTLSLPCMSSPFCMSVSLFLPNK